MEYRSSVPLFVMVAGLLGLSSCTSEKGRVEAQAPLTWDDVGVISTFGEVEQAGWLPLLRRPAGLALVDGFVLWAVQERDSTTSITAYGSEEARLRVTIDGWYQILGNGPGGDLLFGNSFSTRGTWGFIPSVMLVDGRQLLGHMRDIDQRSTR